MEKRVCLILRDLGMLPRFTGYKYLVDAILLELECQGSLEHITKDIYPELAKRYHASIWMIETDIRNMITRCWTKARTENVEKYFPGMAGQKRPTNTQFIERVVKYIRTHDE